MQKIILHIEFDHGEVPGSTIRDALDDALELLRQGSATTEEEFADLGWRYFSTLSEAEAWEEGTPGLSLSETLANAEGTHLESCDVPDRCDLLAALRFHRRREEAQS